MKKKILEKDSRLFRLKGLLYVLKADKKKDLLKYFFKRPFLHTFNIIKSFFKKRPYTLDQRVYCFNVSDISSFKKKLQNPNTILIVGFSYCQKPKNCPSKRFSSNCINDPNSPVCQNCFIGNTTQMKKNIYFLNIPDIQYISKQIIEKITQNPEKEVLFLISSCEFSIKMFADFSNILKITGLGIELSGYTCLNFKSFLFAENSIKNTTTYLSKNDQSIFLDLINSKKS